MALTTVVVTIHVDDTDGPAVGVKVNFRLNRTEVYQGHIIPEFVTVTTDGSGDATISIWPNALGSTESSYEVTMIDANSRFMTSFLATIPNSACNLWEVANLPVYPGKSDSQIAADLATTERIAAEVAAAAALVSENNAATTYDTFDDRYLGAFGTAPTLDNDGDALLTGAMYFNSGDDLTYIYTGSVWAATFAGTSSSIVDNGDATAITIGTDESSTFSGDVLLSKTLTENIGTSVASANALTLSDGNLFDVTGTTMITSIDTVSPGTRAVLKFEDSLVIQQGIKDAAYFDDVNELLEMYRFDGTDWAKVGSSFSIATTASPSLAALNSTDVAFMDATIEELRTYRFNGTTWAQVGNGLSIAGASSSGIAGLDSTDVALIDSANNKLETYSFDGTDWAQVGSSFTLSTGSPALTPLNSTDVAFVDATNQELRTYRFSGSTWSIVGSGLAVSSAGAPSLATLNSTDIALMDSTNNELRTYRFSGSTWSQVGVGLSIPTTGVPALAAVNSTDIAFIGSTTDELRNYRFDGHSWIQIGNNFTMTGAGNPALTALVTDYSLILPGSKDIVTAAGDIAIFYEYSTGLWQCISYTKAAVTPMEYLEGTWSPVISDGINDASSYGKQQGYYEKIGRVVHFRCFVRTTSLGSVSGVIRITGLPFAAGVGVDFVALSTAKAKGLAITAGTSVIARITAGSDFLFLQQQDAITGESDLDDTHWTADGELSVSGSYHV